MKVIYNIFIYSLLVRIIFVVLFNGGVEKFGKVDGIFDEYGSFCYKSFFFDWYLRKF